MNQDLTEIVFILDRSGSMNGLESDTIGGFNGFVEKQAELGLTCLTTVLFDDKYEILHNGVDARNVRLTDQEYFTRGSTALLDAVGKTINDVGKRLKKTPEAQRPGKVIFIITTDGLENASKKFSYDDVKKMITHQTEKYSWEFIFMGANIDAVHEGSKLGIQAASSLNFMSTATGIVNMFGVLGGLSTSIRTGGHYAIPPQREIKNLKIKNLKWLRYLIKSPCSKCPYKLGIVKCVNNPCPDCKLNNYKTYEMLIKGKDAK
jgi:uncharacterized protein YegL